MNLAITTIGIKQERDFVTIRKRGRQIAELLGFTNQDNTRVTTCVSEIARLYLDYAGGGKAEFIVENARNSQNLLVRISTYKNGSLKLNAILDGNYKSADGISVIGSHRLLDDFKIKTSGSESVAELRKKMPKSARPVDAARLREITDALMLESADDPLEEIQRQNQELLQTLAELRASQESLIELNRELEDTNRGVVALYAELDHTAEELRRADVTKTQFLSNMSHEFRTPLNSQLALTRMLLDRLDGDLSDEQEKQVRLIRRGTESLLDLVNDLLDLAKIAAGKVAVRAETFTVEDLFSTLRGMIRPLLSTDVIELVFEENAENLPPLFTDEGKVAQILRNFLSNALKFTVEGEVRVAAKLSPEKQHVVFSVADTGIGIAPDDLDRIFEEFTQIENSQQKTHKGTGLGLPLSRKLAELLGGSVAVESELGKGTTFYAAIPCVFNAETNLQTTEKINFFQIEAVPNSNKILIIDDDESARYVLRKLIDGNEFEIIDAANGDEGLVLAQNLHPKIIFLDWEMPGIHGREVLHELKAHPQTQAIPVIVVTSVEQKHLRESENEFSLCLNKQNLEAEDLLKIIRTQIEK